jgi:predicted amidohydrolase
MTSVPDLDLNIKSILNGIRKAKEYKADIVLFPENCAFMGRGAETFAAATEESEHPIKVITKTIYSNSFMIFLSNIYKLDLIYN